MQDNQNTEAAPVSIESARNTLAAELAKFSGSFKEWYHGKYLRSDHWLQLKGRKFTLCGKRCHYCRRTHQLDVHHLRYKAIYDVLLTDLQVVCRNCHENIHRGLPTLPPLQVRLRRKKEPKPLRLTTKEKHRLQQKRRAAANYLQLMGRGRL